MIGQVGFDPGTEWGTGVNSTADNTLRRGAATCVGDSDGTNAFDPSVGWTGFATDTADGLGLHEADCGDRPARPVPIADCDLDAVTIGSVQGAGATSPVVGESRAHRGHRRRRLPAGGGLRRLLRAGCR